MNRKSIIEELQKSKSLKRWDIRGINLSDIDFSGVDATAAHFSGCAMRHCRFDGAVLGEAVFERCQMDGASFKGAALEGARFNACRGIGEKTAQALGEAGAEVVGGSRGAAMFGVLALASAVIIFIAILIYKVNSQSDIDQPEPSPTETPIMDVNALLAEGVNALAARDYEKALPLLKEAAEKAPGNQDARFQLARCLLESGKYAEARNEFEAILARSPAQDIDIPARQFLAECYQREGKDQSADAVYKALAKTYASSAEIIRGLVLNHANLRWKTKQYQGALDLLNELLELGNDEQDAGVYLLMGLVYKDWGNREKAQESFEKTAWEFDMKLPPVLDARVQLALLDIEDGNQDKAVSFLKELLKQGADEGQVFNALFQVYQKLFEGGQEQQAEVFLGMLTKLFADSEQNLATLHVELGKNAMKLNHLKKALEHFQKVVELSKDPRQSAWASESIEEILRRDLSEKDEKNAAAAQDQPPAKPAASPGESSSSSDA